MKTVGLLGIACFAACMNNEAGPETSTVTSAINDTNIAQTLPWTEKWTQADKVNDLWPESATTARILYRQGPDLLGQPAYLAFVVWNHNQVGHIYWIEKGSSEGSDLKNAWNSAFAQRTNFQNNLFDHWGGGTGGGGVGTPPTPHPNVTQFTVSSTWLANARSTAASLDAADHQFETYAE